MIYIPKNYYNILCKYTENTIRYNSLEDSFQTVCHMIAVQPTMMIGVL